MKVLVFGERETELGEWVVWDLVSSPDGSRAAFGARVGDDLWWKVMEVEP